MCEMVKISAKARSSADPAEKICFAADPAALFFKISKPAAGSAALRA
jgi:hypothetical protein